jgi:hypothetical protein
MAVKHKITTWYEVGYFDASNGHTYRPPEHYASRMAYQRGFEAAATGGPSTDPFLERSQS